MRSFQRNRFSYVVLVCIGYMLAISSTNCHRQPVHRVKELAKFLEVARMNQYKDPNPTVLDTVPALNIVYSKAKDQGYEFKCNLYYKLLLTPIKTEAAVNSLAEEERISFEVHNPHANLIAGLDNEKRYDALARILTFVDALESEKYGESSFFGVSLHKEMLSCVDYFIYRHEIALNNVVSYVQDSKRKLKPQIDDQPKTNEEAKEQIYAAMKEVVRIEDKSQTGSEEWLLAMNKLSKMIVDINFNVPTQIFEFLENRAVDLDEQERLASELDLLVSKVNGMNQNLEATTKSEYQNLINQITAIGQHKSGFFRDEVSKLLPSINKLADIEMPVEQYMDEIRQMMQKEKEEKEKARIEEEEERIRLHNKKNHSFSKFFSKNH